MFQLHFKPVLAKSHDGQLPFAERAAPSLISVVSCSLQPMGAAVLWAECPTGMMVSWFRSSDGGAHFTHWWETSGTGGDAFDPLSSTVAYRYTGIGPAPAYALQRTTDGGASFTTVSRLFPDEGSESTLAFSDEEHGYVLGPGPNGPVLLYTGDGGEHWTTVFRER